MPLQKPTTTLPGVGNKLADILKKCRIHTVQDLLFHLPFRYQDRTRITPITDLRNKEFSVIEGEVIKQETRPGRRSQLTVYLQDSSHFIKLRFFHVYPELKLNLAVGTQLRCFGEARLSHLNMEMVHPEIQIIKNGCIEPVDETLTPIYSLTAGISQTKLRQLTKNALTLLDNTANIELLPNSLLQKHHYPCLKDCLHFLHNPPPDADISLILEQRHPKQLRLAFEELLSHHLSFRRIKDTVKQYQAKAFSAENCLKQDFIQQLPFSLTDAQQRVITEIENDLTLNVPMCRLVQGDVGSGKTLVAAISCLKVIAAKHQVALMAPTELLAEQHFRNFKEWFSPLGIEVSLVLGKQGVKQKREAYEGMSSGKSQIIIGTHALFQKEVAFKALGLIIIDEQHRFGVKQRLDLQEKGNTDKFKTHQLVMTATPIPRTLAMTHYASLDLSIIDELPPGRTPIKTAVIDNVKRQLVVERLVHAFKEKKQAYWVCPLIEESEVLQCQAAETTAKALALELEPYKLGLIHGRMKADEKQQIMQEFATHKLDLLIATTVIEVGVDVPNASLMIIENAERLGLSQLHQLRGRVGRGREQSHCLLLYQTPLSYTSQKRLQVMRDSTDGFFIAEEDLKLRGSGELLGTRQTGQRMLKVANLHQHQALLEKIDESAELLLKERPETVEQLIQRWQGDGEKYAQS